MFPRNYLPVSPWIILIAGIILVLFFEFSGILKSGKRRGLFGLIPWVLIFGTALYFIVYFGEEIQNVVNNVLRVFP